MKIDREVVIDLLPVYFSGEASQATRDLVEECFREDPDLERIARNANRNVDTVGVLTQLPDQEKEKETLVRLRNLVRYRNQMLGFSLAYSLIPIGLIIAAAFFAKDLAHNLTVLALWFSAYAAGCWIAFFALSQHTRKVGTLNP